LYLAPPDNAIVLCLDEKSSVQAPDRTQPSLPMVKGRAATMTHTTRFPPVAAVAPPAVGTRPTNGDHTQRGWRPTIAAARA
jgi:hypothetical protein